MIRALIGLLLVALFATSCTSDSTTAVVPPDPKSVFDPTLRPETRPPGYQPVLPRDQIRPVYAPEFTDAASVGWSDEALVIGVFLKGEARAYPVGFLTRREMVVDNHRGIPTLVTW